MVTADFIFCYRTAIDFFSGSPGMHTSATVLAGFVRPYVLRIVSPRDGYESGSDPSMLNYGFRWFFFYTCYCACSSYGSFLP
jgi:hypothetical protein